MYIFSFLFCFLPFENFFVDFLDATRYLGFLNTKFCMYWVFVLFILRFLNTRLGIYRAFVMFILKAITGYVEYF